MSARVLLGLTLLALLARAVSLPAQPRKPATVAEIATYMGADREQLLSAGARAEGIVTWYTSLAGDSYKALARAFEAKSYQSSRRWFRPPVRALE